MTHIDRCRACLFFELYDIEQWVFIRFMGSALVALPVIKIKTITAEWNLMKRNRFSILEHASSWVLGIGVMVYCRGWYGS